MFKWWSLRGGWIIWMRNPEWCRKLVPKMRWSMSVGAVSDFEWWWWFDQSDIRWRACVVTVRRLNKYEVTQIRRLSSIENFVSDFIFNSFRNFKPMKRFQNRSNVLEFWTLDNSSSNIISNDDDHDRKADSWLYVIDIKKINTVRSWLERKSQIAELKTIVLLLYLMYCIYYMLQQFCGE